ncbi:serine/threonine-protein kinase ATM isoform X1 [Cicer arietinum]|uniref:Serine/threonine-protein kinase ATM isoform X1 n=1 Tax=Cicer arietinum TaxID=3827 RepID=A0A1S2YAU5_CICAR|nr:serine/threonine-protein kinase ATM isoform X1 [Cicer arietinum]XP_004502087.1 serine/threonine-protein kinase ATM isoform X1 [Cicer arietinum]XP_012571777.1 serine/threonine-protein kinase ATM isoform X1 [Cicer arietinum]
MDVVQAVPENVDSGYETKITENTPVTNTSEKTGGGLDSRSRRRSKYLSYPYTNSGPRHKDSPAEKRKSRTPCLALKTKASSKTSKPSNGSSLSAKPGSKRFRNNWYRKFISCSSMSSSPKFIHASSGDLLSGLYSIAVDCMSPIENKSFDLVEWFFCKYRISKFHDEAELATSMVSVNGGKTAKLLSNDLLDTESEKKRKNTKMENAVKRKMKSLSGLLDMKTEVSTGDCAGSRRKLTPKRKVEDMTSLHPLQNTETTINESGNRYGSILETPQSHSCLASERKTRPKKRQKLIAAQEHQGAQFASYVDAKSTKGSSLVIDLQVISPPIPVVIHEKSNGENKDGLVFKVSNPEIRASQGELDGNVTGRNLLVSTASEAGTATREGLVGNITNHNLLVNAASDLNSVSQLGFVGNITNHNLLSYTTSDVGIVTINKTGMKNRKEKAPVKRPNTKHATAIPDLNSTSFESCSTRKESATVNFLSPELKSENPKILSACSRHTKTVNFDRVEDNGESPGTFLFLQFTPGVDFLSKDDLLRTFCRFGPLKAAETQLMKDTGSAQVVFVRGTDAAEACRTLEHNNPFGATLVGYRLHHPPVAAPPLAHFLTPTQPTRSMSMPGEAPPPLQFIKQNLQMMTSMLENSGNSLSPQMRAKLDTEIKNLLRKVNSKGTV